MRAPHVQIFCDMSARALTVLQELAGPKMSVSVVARCIDPDIGSEGDVVVTNDNLDELAKAVQRRADADR